MRRRNERGSVERSCSRDGIFRKAHLGGVKAWSASLPPGEWARTMIRASVAGIKLSARSRRRITEVARAIANCAGSADIEPV